MFKVQYEFVTFQYLHSETDEAHGRRNWNLEAIVFGHQLVEFTGQFDLLANVSPQSLRPVRTHYKPEFQ